MNLINNKMKVAIFQGWDIRHFEMLGYILDFCYKFSLEFVLFSPEFKDWKPYYDKVFNKDIEWKVISEFRPMEFDYIFLVTDDDPFFKDEWVEESPNKIICIDHWTGKIRRENVLVHVNTRYATKYNNMFWALPTYPVIKTVEDKQQIISTNKRIQVVCIGYNSTPKSSDNLRGIFTNFDEIDFHIVNHYIHYRYDDVINIKEYVDASVEVMTDLLRKADYVLCLQNNNQKDYIHDTMSAAIPLAFNFGCRLIMPASWKDSYKYTSPIQYTYSETTLTLTSINSHAIQNVLQERDRLIAYRNVVFKGIMKL